MTDKQRIDSDSLQAAIREATREAAREAMDSRLMTKDEVCEWLHIRQTKLRLLTAIRPIRLGHHVRYLAGDVKKYVRALAAESDGGSTLGPGRPRGTDQ